MALARLGSARGLDCALGCMMQPTITTAQDSSVGDALACRHKSAEQQQVDQHQRIPIGQEVQAATEAADLPRSS
jgi:hypothetical protein